MQESPRFDSPAVTPVPRSDNPPSWRRRAWRLLSGLLLLLIVAVVYWWSTDESYVTLRPGGELVGPLLFSPDSKSLFTVAWGSTPAGAVKVWDVERGLLRLSFGAVKERIRHAECSPDGRFFAVLQMDGEFKVWSVASGQELTWLRPGGRFGQVSAFRFLSTRALLALDTSASRPGSSRITFWDVEEGQPQAVVEGELSSLSFTPDGKAFAVCSWNEGQRSIQVWQWELPQAPVRGRQYSLPLEGAVLAPDGASFATLASGELALWDLATGAKRCTAQQQHDNGWTLEQSLFFAANGELIVIGNPPHQFTLWKVKPDLERLGTVLNSPLISADGNWLALFRSRHNSPLTVGPWLTLLNRADLQENCRLKETEIPLSDAQNLNDYQAFSPFFPPGFSLDGTALLFGGCLDRPPPPCWMQWLPARLNPFPNDISSAVVWVWEVPSGRELMTFEECTSASFSPDGRVLATQHRGNLIQLWHWPLCKPLWRILGWSLLAWGVPTVAFWFWGRQRFRCSGPGAGAPGPAERV